MGLRQDGKHMFGIVTMGERGQIVIPKKARDIFEIKPGDSLFVLGDESQGLALIKSEVFLHFANAIFDAQRRGEEGNEDECD